MSIWPSIWAAIAASCSAIAATAIWRIHRRNAIDAVRPILVPVNCGVSDEGTQGFLRVPKIHNHGQGPAYRVRGELKVKGRPKAFAGLAGQVIAIIPAGQQGSLGGTVVFFWKDGAAVTPDTNIIGLDLRLVCSDLHGNRHELLMYLLATRGDPTLSAGEVLGPGVHLVDQRTFVISALRLRFLRRSANLKNRIAELADIFRARIQRHQRSPAKTGRRQENK